MAWGNIVQHWQAYIETSVSYPNDTQATVAVRTYAHSIGWGYSVAARAYSVVDGSSSGWSGTFTFSSPTGGTVNQLCSSRTVTVDRGSEARDISCSGTVQVTGGYHNGTSTASETVTIAAISYKQPHPPKNCSVARVSDTQQKIAWESDYTGMDGLYPWSNVLVDRAVDGGGWQQIAKLDWSALNYSDNSTGAGHSYQYGLRSKGPGGTSTRAVAGTVVTTPLAPTSVTIAKVTDTSVRIEAEGASAYAEGYEIQSRLNGGEWRNVKTVTSFPTIDSPGAGRATYRVRAVAAGLYSAWTESAEIATIAPPLAPTVSLSAPAVPTGGSATVTWAPNHIDGTDQSSAQVELTPPTGSTMTVDVPGPTTRYALDAPAKGQWRIRVRTKGLDPSWGAWSAYAVLTVADPPQAWWTAPGSDGATVEAVPLEAKYSASDATGVTEVSVALYRAGPGSTRTLVDSASPDPAARSWTVGSYATVANGASYVLVLTVRGGSGLSATSERSFSTSWPEPLPPAPGISYGEGLSAAVTVRPGEGEGPAPTSYDVARVLPDGSATTLATGLAEGQQAFDRLPPLNVAYSYRVTSIAESGVAVTRDFPAAVRAEGMALNFGADASRAFVAPYDVDYSGDSGMASETYHFAGRGGLPLSYALDELDASTSATFSMLADQHAEFERLRRSEREGWWRGPSGERVFGSMSFRSSLTAPGLWQGGVDIVETEWEEPLSG